MQTTAFRSTQPTTRELTSYTRFIEATCSQSRVSSSVCLGPFVDTNTEPSNSRSMGMEEARK